MFNNSTTDDYVEFTNFDRVMFAGIIAISIAIGVYFGICKRQKTTDDYLLGGKKMGVVPISFSLVASYTSAITITGMPAEIYTFGTQYLMTCLSAFSTSFIVAKVFLPGNHAYVYPKYYTEGCALGTFGPQFRKTLWRTKPVSPNYGSRLFKSTSFLTVLWVYFYSLCNLTTRRRLILVFYELQLASSFEYLSLRFNRSVGKIASFLCLCSYVTGIPLVMYIPALALNLVSGINIHYITITMCIICIFYTTLGGLKAVVWSDTIQLVIMYSCIFAILCFGIPLEGGIEKIWSVAKEADRIHFLDLNPSWYPRMTFWSMWLGMGTIWTTIMGVNQAAIQRFLSLPSMSSAIKVLYIYCAVVVIFKALCLFSGLVMFARYRECDPYIAGVIKSYDQILPYYVMDSAKNLPGLPGIFIAGIFCAGLSTMSTLLNTCGGMVYKDFLSDILPIYVQKNHANSIIKFVVVIIGALCTLVLFWVDRLPSVIEFVTSIDGVICGPLLGTFALGMLLPRSNTKGVISGALTSMVFMVWITIKSRQIKSQGYGYYPKPFPTNNSCDINVNATTIKSLETSDEIFFLYRISFTWYSLIGLLTTLIVAIPVSYLTAPPVKEKVKPEYFSPFVRSYFDKKTNNDVEMKLVKN